MQKNDWNKEAAAIIKTRIRLKDFAKLEKTKGGEYVCPFCGSGTGPNKSGAFHVYDDTNQYHCFACGEHGDVIDYYMNENEKTFPEAVEELAATIGLHYDGEAPAPTTKTAAPEPAKKSSSQARDFTEYFRSCRKRLAGEEGKPAADYLNKRGINLEVALSHFVGYDPESDPAGAGHPTPRLIIPTTKSHYVARAIYDDKVEKKYRKMNPAGSTSGVFNMKALQKQDVQEVFLVEGALDALSFLTVGAEAIALNSADNAKKFIKRMEEHRPSSQITFIIAMDKDDRGKKAAAELAAGFRRLGLPFIVAGDIYGGKKDANEALVSDPVSFMAAVESLTGKTAARPDNVLDYISSLMAADIEHYKRKRETGFCQFDEVTGGLRPGLYVLAAISSLGKTSFCLQMADQMAERGEDVIFFSLEMSRLELVSKSLARTAAQLHPEDYITSAAIREGGAPVDAVSRYKETIGNRLSIVEGNFDVNISSIGDYIRNYIAKTGTRPTVIIDYLQILQPKEDDARKMKREAIDSTVSELKRLSREIDAPMIVISSVNRANYQTPISFESLKESGNIEYSADVVLGLQLQCLNEPLFETDTKTKIVEKRERVKREKLANPRKVELVALKNRFGVSSFSCLFDYYPAKDLFVENLTDPDLDMIL